MTAPGTIALPVIRRAREEDAASLLEIFNEGVQDGLATLDTERRSLAEQRRLLTAAAADPRHPILVAELRGWVAGWITVETCDTRPQMSDIGEVTVFVRRDFRKYGVGRQLMRALQTEARALGYRKFVGYVLAENTDSLNLCRACGWREVGRHEQHARRVGGLRDVIVVEYLVPEAPAA
jgi:L-amino acid N-acyltransferase YncA